MTTRRVAMVTGAAGGQGLAIAERLRGEGFCVAAADLRRAELTAAVDVLHDDGVIAVPLDVTDPSQ